MVKVIAKSAERIKNLSMHLIDAIKLRDDQQVFNIQKTNLTSLVADFIDEANALYTKEKNISIIFNEDRDIYADADYESIGQVLRNIVINAIKYSPENSSVSIKINPDQHQVQVEIRDEGVGIAETELDAVFNQFYQSARTKTGAGGVGLGLNITKQIIEQHGGKIWVENNEDKGCKFIFTLRNSDTTTSETLNNKNHKKVLIIDDDELILSSLTLSLIAHGFDVSTASSGIDGINTLEKCSSFDFVILDIMMPEMDGFEVLKIIKPKWPNLKVLIHSGISNAAEASKTVKDLGAYTFIKKPYKIKELLACFS